jgi:membrane-bound lytic murein transglycosylase A
LDQRGNITGWLPFSRFILLQDSGAAIVGRGRLDLFWGSDRYAEIAAGHMKQPGRLYLLVLKLDNGPVADSHLKNNPLQAE